MSPGFPNAAVIGEPRLVPVGKTNPAANDKKRLLRLLKDLLILTPERVMI